MTLSRVVTFVFVRPLHLPIPRILISLEDLWMWIDAILPGVFISVILGYIVFSVRLNVSVVLAVLS